jgi:hypothetical protein
VPGSVCCFKLLGVGITDYITRDEVIVFSRDVISSLNQFPFFLLLFLHSTNVCRVSIMHQALDWCNIQSTQPRPPKGSQLEGSF